MVDVAVLCKRAEEVAVKCADVVLDYSEKSLKDVDKIVSDTKGLYDKMIIDEPTVWNMAVIFGLYTGEVSLRNKYEFKDYVWIDNSDRIPVLASKDGEIKFDPITEIYKRIRDL